MAVNQQLIRSLYEAFGRGDLKSILDNLDPAVTWISICNPETTPWGGRREGVSGAASFFKALADNLDFEKFEPREYFEAGESVVVIGRTRARVKSGGGVFDCE